VAAGLNAVLDELQEISRGIHPAILSTAGPRSALRALGRRSVIPVNVEVRIDCRLPEPIEWAPTTSSREHSPTRAKHARASIVEVDAGSL